MHLYITKHDPEFWFKKKKLGSQAFKSNIEPKT